MLSTAQVIKYTVEYYDDVHRFCLHNIKDKSTADDITQETFLLFIDKAEKLEEINIKSWLLKVAKNKALKYFKAAAKQSEQEKKQNQVPEMKYDWENYSVAYELEITEYSDEQIEDFKEKIVNCLSDEEKELYRAIYVEHKSQKEAGDEFGINEKAANARIFRLKKKMTKYAKGVLGLLSVLFALLKMKF